MKRKVRAGRKNELCIKTSENKPAGSTLSDKPNWIWDVRPKGDHPPRSYAFVTTRRRHSLRVIDVARKHRQRMSSCLHPLSRIYCCLVLLSCDQNKQPQDAGFTPTSRGLPPSSAFCVVFWVKIEAVHFCYTVRTFLDARSWGFPSPHWVDEFQWPVGAAAMKAAVQQRPLSDQAWTVEHSHPGCRRDRVKFTQRLKTVKVHMSDSLCSIGLNQQQVCLDLLSWRIRPHCLIDRVSPWS